MCGKETELFLTDIEDTQMNLCGKCSKFGKTIKKIKTYEEIKQEEKAKKTEENIINTKETETIQIINPEYAQMIKNAREKLKLKQKEFAKKIKEKESVIHQIETGSFEPNIHLARKLENFLKITLIEEYEEKKQKTNKTHSDALTIGDLISIKKS